MKYPHLLTLQNEAGFSPEQLAKRLGISGMTLRRWEKTPPEGDLPPLYETALVGVIYELVGEGKLSLESSLVKTVMSEHTWGPFEATMTQLGFSKETLKGGKYDEGKMIEGLSEIGVNEFKRAAVEKSEKKILSFKNWGKEWSSRITSLMTVLKSKELHTFDKLVAYGALFYLINPFDLIPDYIPVFGYMDDFFILGLAAAYYVKRFPYLFGKKSK
jgi:uncharacterized membrane protein YkvA (DUF1232 family)/DNA-binding XRE family transcriptional regulator